MQNDIAIKVTNLSKKYSIGKNENNLTIAERLRYLFRKKKEQENTEEFYALKDINFEIKKGEAVGIIGRNGSGKSTLLKILSSVTEPTEGRVEINGTIASVLEVGMGFHPELTGRENVFLSGTMLGIQKKQIEEKFNEIVEFAGVEKFIDTPVKHYSSGMYVRLAFSVVTNIDADILLFDEVLSVGDLAFQMKCGKKIRELVGTGKTVILVSHNMADLISLCRNKIYIEDGTISGIGDNIVIQDYIEDASQQDKMIHGNNEKNQIVLVNKIYHEWHDYYFDENIKLISFELINETDKNRKEFFTDDLISCNIVYEKLDNIDFYDFVVLVSDYNAIFLGAHYLNSNLIAEELTKKGRYHAKVFFDRNFFNQTHLNFGIFVSKNQKELFFFEQNILNVKIIFSNLAHKRQTIEYMKQFNAPLKPQLKWEINKNFTK